MKKFLLIFSLVVLQICLFAQEKDFVKKEMHLTYDNIAKKAAKKWPGDFEMQKYTIDEQCKALVEYINLSSNYTIPKDIFYQIKGLAYDKWCENDWVKCSQDNTTLDANYACFSADWEMIVL